MSHDWQTYKSTDFHRHDECRDCDALRVRGVNSNWRWHYRHGGETCTGQGDSSPAERALAMEGRE